MLSKIVLFLLLALAATRAVSAECGDGILNTTLGEECDDGNIVGGDNCSSECFLENDCCQFWPENTWPSSDPCVQNSSSCAPTNETTTLINTVCLSDASIVCCVTPSETNVTIPYLTTEACCASFGGTVNSTQCSAIEPVSTTGPASSPAADEESSPAAIPLWKILLPVGSVVVVLIFAIVVIQLSSSG
jgi:cysteine-rich repeat protein